MRAKQFRVTCNKCGSRIVDSWESKWKHLTRKHPDVLASHILPLLADPEYFTEIGAAVGNVVKRVLRIQ